MSDEWTQPRVGAYPGNAAVTERTDPFIEDCLSHPRPYMGRSASEDLVQEFRLLVWRNQGRILGIAADHERRKFVGTIARNVRRKKHRTDVRHPEAQLDASEWEALSISRAPHLIDFDLRKALRALPEAQRRILVQHFFHGQSYAEIGACLRINAKAAGRRIERAMINLRAAFYKENK